MPDAWQLHNSVKPHVRDVEVICAVVVHVWLLQMKDDFDDEAGESSDDIDADDDGEMDMADDVDDDDDVADDDDDVDDDDVSDSEEEDDDSDAEEVHNTDCWND